MTIVANQMTVFRCCFCQQLMVDGRSDKKTCSTKCRVKLCRWRKRLDALENEAENIFKELEEYLKFYDAVPRAVQVLDYMKTKSNAIMKQANIQGVR